jgi:BirA family biotin operon repressor/biotin-[acetyl-CoA-carboxylase] ligase
MNDTRLLALFEEAGGVFLSGEELSGKLGISRTAVWKQIERLRRQGYRFEAVPRRGYRLIARPEKLDVARILRTLQTEWLGRSIKYLEQVDSTNTLAHQLVAKGEAQGTLIVAEEQLSGRGRMGRSWHSPAGKGIWMSFILRPDIPLLFTPQLTLLTAVAVCRAIRAVGSAEAGIKWPNDILIGGRKVCGILLETSAEEDRLLHVVAGIGVSVNLTEDDYPPELRSIATSLLIETGRRVSREELLCRILQEWESLFSLYRAEGFSPVRTLWETLSVTLHRPVRSVTPQGVIEGTALALDESGALIVQTADGQLHKLYSGVVEFG